MTPILSSLKKLTWAMFAWLLVGAAFAKLLNLAELAAWKNALFFAAPMTLIFGFIASSAYYVCQSLPLSRRKFYLVSTIFGCASLISGFTWLGICQLWNQFGLSLDQSWAGITLSPQLKLLLISTGCILYLVSLLAHDVFIAFENLRAAERREASSQLLAREAELQVLRTQINPHFLFNSLNSISALTAIDAAGARSMTIELAEFFRQTLALSEKERITLQQEISLCNNFLAIEKIRFGKKLQVSMDLDPRATDCLIPPMILQPMVENAIKHGIRDLVDGGTIVIKSLVRDNWVYLSIQNPIDAQPSNTAGNGTGLKNLQARFASIYGDKGRVSITKSTHDFVVEMAIPVEFSQPETAK